MALIGHHPVDDRREQSLVINDSDDRKEHDQQPGKGQRFLERVSDSVLFGNAVEGRCQHDDKETNDTRLGQVKSECEDQYEGDDTLDANSGALLLRALIVHGTVVVFQDVSHLVRERRAVSEYPEVLETGTGQQTDGKHGHRDRRHLQKERHELPVHDLGDQEVLRFANQCRYTAKCGTDGTMHHQVSQETSELHEVRPVQFDDLVILSRIMAVIEVLA